MGLGQIITLVEGVPRPVNPLGEAGWGASPPTILFLKTHFRLQTSLKIH